MERELMKATIDELDSRAKMFDSIRTLVNIIIIVTIISIIIACIALGLGFSFFTEFKKYFESMQTITNGIHK